MRVPHEGQSNDAAFVPITLTPQVTQRCSWVDSASLMESRIRWSTKTVVVRRRGGYGQSAVNADPIEAGSRAIPTVEEYGRIHISTAHGPLDI